MHSGGPPHNRDSTGELDLPVEITCRQFVELVTDYFEGALDARTMSRVEEHLVMCDWCVTYAGQMRATIAALAGLAREPPPEPPDSVLAVLRARRAGEA